MRNVTAGDMAFIGYELQPKELPSKEKLEQIIFVLEFKKENPNASERIVKRAFNRKFGKSQIMPKN